ncbi:hypothetical protein PK98_15030 [Croceibacterium mercuriale]|uniref:Uncharacterized protein n=1 Tax=Croceibacterium mercuriale TaxID=1572751 RepID=A0A0B2BXA6_9SPHN|nr:hypothetical protein [Croceibacterium mercuriale]KHL24276.1 hypothetical protein PK98_15030 [Croceibacterium mercuriale]
MMSTFGFGIIAGVIPALFIAGMTANTRFPLKTAILLVGVIGFLLAPPLLEGIPDFILGLCALPGLLWILKRGEIKQQQQEQVDKAAEAAELIEQSNLVRRAAENQKRLWLEDLRTNFPHQVTGIIISKPTTTTGVLVVDHSENVLRLFGYRTNDAFTVEVTAAVRATDILSVEIVRPSTKKRVRRMEAVPVVTSQKKSPVARGLVGGALLGPVGLVVGAASGIGRDVSTKIEEHVIWDEVDAPGPAVLHIGTTILDSPLIRFKPEREQDAEDWLHRIKAWQASSSAAQAITESVLPLIRKDTFSAS